MKPRSINTKVQQISIKKRKKCTNRKSQTCLFELKFSSLNIYKIKDIHMSQRDCVCFCQDRPMLQALNVKLFLSYDKHGFLGHGFL